MRKGGDGSHWEGCYEAHHDCAIARIADLEDEVERLKARRCEGCALLTYMECPVWPAIHRAGHTPPPDNFACNLWAEHGGRAAEHHPKRYPGADNS